MRPKKESWQFSIRTLNFRPSLPAIFADGKLVAVVNQNFGLPTAFEGDMNLWRGDCGPVYIKDLFLSGQHHTMLFNIANYGNGCDGGTKWDAMKLE